MKKKKIFLSWLTERYLLIIRNEDNLSEKKFFGFSYLNFFSLSFSLFLLMLLIGLLLSRTLLEKWFDPTYAQVEANKKLYTLSLKLDSLDEEVQYKDQFISLFKSFLTEGANLSKVDSFREGSFKKESRYKVPFKIDSVEKQLREEYEVLGKAINLEKKLKNDEMEGIFLFPPVSGIISQKYNIKDGHVGIDIVSKRNEPIMSVASGTVIMSSWTQNFGYVIVIQHRSNLISVYKHNAELFKKIGNFVTGGDVIAIIGNTGELTDGPHLHLELWYKGNTVNPEDFIFFK